MYAALNAEINVKVTNKKNPLFFSLESLAAPAPISISRQITMFAIIKKHLIIISALPVLAFMEIIYKVRAVITIIVYTNPIILLIGSCKPTITTTFFTICHF
jgi:hypothetical protein